jgi:hypothetical protein
MKAFFTLAFILCSLAYSLATQAQETLTNNSIISMHKSKIAKDLMLDKIKLSPSKFDMSTTGLIELDKASVPAQVIDAMMLASSPLPILRNQDIIDLHVGGVARDIITKKIQYSDSDFSLTTEALIDLKTAKVPDQLVKVMMIPKRATQQSSNPNLIAGALPPHPDNLPTPPRSRFPSSGIYYEEYKGTAPKYEEIEPTTTNQTKNGSVGEGIVSSATGGLTGTSQRVGLANPSANFIVEDNKPVFYMVFSGQNRKVMNEVAESIFDGVASPNEFVLLRVKASRRGREFVIGRNSSYTSETGFGEGAVPFRFRKISNQLYKIYFDQEIAAGEYAFFYNKGSEFTSSLKLYDFSLRNNVK